MRNTILAAILAAVLAGALGFFGGVTYQKSQTSSFGGASGRFGGGGGRGGFGGANAQVATGTVIAQDATSITVKGGDGGSKTIFISAQTSISKQTVLKPSDIKVGDQVGAFGQTASGGIDARMVQIIPPGGSFRFGGMGGGRGFGGNQGNGTNGGQSGGTNGGQSGEPGGPPGGF
jgi:hypothetical protein